MAGWNTSSNGGSTYDELWGPQGFAHGVGKNISDLINTLQQRSGQFNQNLADGNANPNALMAGDSGAHAAYTGPMARPQGPVGSNPIAEIAPAHAVFGGIGGDFGGDPVASDPSIHSGNTFDPFANSLANGGGQLSPQDQILKDLGDHFNFDPSQVNTQYLDSMLQDKLGALTKARGLAQTDFNKSDGNIKGMHDAFQHQIEGQAGQIKADGQRYGDQVSGTFNKSIADDKAYLNQYAAQKAEMLKRLGIAPAANAPDLMGQAVQQGINSENTNKDARTGEIAANTQSNLALNTSRANSVGAAGIERRDELNRQLQDLFGKMDQQGATINSDYNNQKAQAVSGAMKNQYDQWLNDRKFEQGVFQTQATNDLNQRKYDMQNQVAQTRVGGAQNQGIAGLNAQTSPAILNGFMKIQQNIDPKQDPAGFYRQLIKEPGVDPAEASQYLTSYANLGSTNKFAPPAG